MLIQNVQLQSRDNRDYMHYYTLKYCYSCLVLVTCILQTQDKEVSLVSLFENFTSSVKLGQSMMVSGLLWILFWKSIDIYGIQVCVSLALVAKFLRRFNYLYFSLILGMRHTVQNTSIPRLVEQLYIISLLLHCNLSC